MWARADTIVWLDLPRAQVLRQVTARTLRHWWTRERLWGTNRQSLRMVFSRESILWWAWSTHGKNRARYERLLRDVPQRVVVLRSRAEVEAWLASV